MEIEFFVRPEEGGEWFNRWVEESIGWLRSIGLKEASLRKHEQPKEELAHYSTATTDIEFAFGFDKGWAELMGIANRTDYDLKAHGFAYRDETTGKEFVPYTIEPSLGVDRLALALLLDAYEEVSGGRSTTTEANKAVETVLRLHKSIAPIKVAVLPLSKKEPLATTAKDILQTLTKEWVCQYDDAQSIGRRYRRQDEIGTPYCVTVDFETATDQSVTVRDRDTMAQERVAIGSLVKYIYDKLDD